MHAVPVLGAEAVSVSLLPQWTCTDARGVTHIVTRAVNGGLTPQCAHPETVTSDHDPRTVTCLFCLTGRIDPAYQARLDAAFEHVARNGFVVDDHKIVEYAVADAKTTMEVWNATRKKARRRRQDRP